MSKACVVVGLYCGVSPEAYDRILEYRELGKLYSEGFRYAEERDEDLLVYNEALEEAAPKDLEYEDLYRWFEEQGYQLYHLEGEKRVPFTTKEA